MLGVGATLVPVVGVAAFSKQMKTTPVVCEREVLVVHRI
jgi:hypothetical protein